MAEVVCISGSGQSFDDFWVLACDFIVRAVCSVPFLTGAALFQTVNCLWLLTELLCARDAQTIGDRVSVWCTWSTASRPFGHALPTRSGVLPLLA